MSSKTLTQSQIRFYISIAWLAFTASLTTWWWWHGLAQLESMRLHIDSVKYESIERMLIYEGIFFLIVIVAGGISLILLAKNEYQRHEQVKLFFANFTHDLRTSMSRLRMQSDLLNDEPATLTNDYKNKIKKLSEHLNQLDLQLENSLWVARGDKQNFHLQLLKISEIISAVRYEWSDLEISLQKDCTIYSDSLALRSVFRNIIQNAVVHGNANKISISVMNTKKYCKLIIVNDGLSFNGDVKLLGQKFFKPKTAHGNGLGIYLTRFILEKVNGDISFSVDKEKKLIIELSLPYLKETLCQKIY